MIREIILGFVIAGSPLMLIEFAARHNVVKQDKARKITHVLSSFATVIVALNFGLSIVQWVAFLFVCLLVVTRKFRFWKSLYEVKRQSIGEIAFPIGVIISAQFASDVRTFAFALLCLGLADTAAYYTGTKHGRHRIKNRQKTVEGFLAAWLVALLLAVLMLPLSILSALLLSFFVAGLELVGTRGYDNILIPLGSVLLLRLF